LNSTFPFKITLNSHISIHSYLEMGFWVISAFTEKLGSLELLARWICHGCGLGCGCGGTTANAFTVKHVVFCKQVAPQSGAADFVEDKNIKEVFYRVS
jgi:hypothetical protein